MMQEKLDLSNLWEIHGKYYDLSKFLEQHPGGKRMLLLAKGTDCTEVYESVHIFNKLPANMLKKFYVGDNENYESLYSWDKDGFYCSLKKNVQAFLLEQSKEQGGNRKYNTRTHHNNGGSWFFIRFIIALVAFYVTTWFAIVQGSLIAAVIFPFLVLPLGGYGHEALHAGFFDSVWKNRFVALVSMDFIGLSSYVYSVVHITGHHAHTNVEKVDPDMEAFYPHIRTFPYQRRRLWHGLQHLYAWPIYFFSLFFANAMDLIALITGKWDTMRVKRPYPMELFLLLVFKIVSITIFLVMPFYLHSSGHALLIVLITTGASGFFINLTFAVSHKNAEATAYLFEDRAEQKYDWGEFQVMTTSNFQHGHWFYDLFFAGLTYQIEHHLFPTISYQHLPKISLIVRETCKEFGVPYSYFPSYLDICKAHFKYLKKLGVS